MPDSDQSGQYRQRLHLRWSLLGVFSALVLAGCTGNAVKPDISTSSPPAETAPGKASMVAESDDQAQDKVIWSRLRRGFQLKQINHPRITQEIRRLQASPKAFRALMARSEPYIHYIVEQIEAGGLPSELTLLPAVESGFRAYACSPDGAAGLWQFMPATGRMLGLEQDWWFDERRTVRSSTLAAIDYLQRLNRKFDGDWLQTLAAYNAGAGTVNRAIRRAKKRHEGTDFWSLDLPGETNRYVPRLLALAAIVARPDTYGLDLPEVADQPYFTVTGTDGQIDLNIAAQSAGMSVEQLLALNAGHKRWASGPGGPHELLLPLGQVERFENALATLPQDQRVRWQHYLIKPGDNLNRIARRHGVTADAIRRSNGLKDSRIRAGKNLLIPLSDSVILAESLSNRKARQRLRYRVRKGDSLYTIARRFQVSVTDIRRWNQVGRHIRPGEKLTVFIDPDA